MVRWRFANPAESESRIAEIRQDFLQSVASFRMAQKSVSCPDCCEKLGLKGAAVAY